MKKQIQTYFRDFSSLLFPNLCIACGRGLLKGEELLCTFCFFHLPKTWFHNDDENPVSKTFWGRVDIAHATACFYFTKGNNVQQMLHELKYKKNKPVGIYIGRYYGRELKDHYGFGTVEVVVPVPLHPKKKRKRGYNQSEMFAGGLCDTMQIKMETKCLVRKTASETQTRKSRFSRWENVKDIFVVKNQDRLIGKHILLVDDVITTGATMEACILALSQIPGSKISVAAIAYAL